MRADYFPTALLGAGPCQRRQLALHPEPGLYGMVVAQRRARDPVRIGECLRRLFLEGGEFRRQRVSGAVEAVSSRHWSVDGDVSGGEFAAVLGECHVCDAMVQARRAARLGGCGRDGGGLQQAGAGDETDPATSPPQLR